MDSNNDSCELPNFKFICKEWDYKCNKKGDYNRHLNTEKHKRCNIKPSKIYNCGCGKNYKYDSGFYRHKKTCTFEKKLEDEENQIICQNDEGNLDYKDMFITMMKENSELRKQVTELIPKVGMNITNNNNNNNITNNTTHNNQKFNNSQLPKYTSPEMQIHKYNNPQIQKSEN